jgi:heterodisulfide reductase subunit C
MFKPDLCDLCGDCLVECQWMDVDQDQAVAWMTEMKNGNPTPAVDQCITCYACNEICPQGANPFDLIADFQEKAGQASCLRTRRPNKRPGLPLRAR